GDARGVYPITSLYYDTPDYKAYWDKIDGQRNRRKVRVRVYGNGVVSAATPAFVEIKARRIQFLNKRAEATEMVASEEEFDSVTVDEADSHERVNASRPAAPVPTQPQEPKNEFNFGYDNLKL
ncbi:VTC domain-containing protein, partial [candidate division KSB1 bacterium]|nr:VTC domain-containing protein [candidate division KSB1 bacterium]